MKTVLLNLIAFVAGMVIGGCVNLALVMVGPLVIPPPPGVNPADASSLAASIHLLEPRHFIFPFLAHAVGTLAGALVAHLIAASARNVFAYVIGGLTLAGGIASACMIPAPKWFIALDLVVAYLPMAWLATRLGARLRPAPAAT